MESIEGYLNFGKQLLGDGFWSVFGAIIGALLGAFLGIVVSIYFDFRRSNKLKNAFYDEAEFLTIHISEFLISVESEYEKQEIDLSKGDKYSGPLTIDFTVFNSLYLELYKIKSIPTNDFRRLVHNVSGNWKNICSHDVDRISKCESSSIHEVNREQCMEIVYLSVHLLYHFEQLALKKERFIFDDSDFKNKAEVVFRKYQIKNDKLINKIAQQRPD